MKGHAIGLEEGLAKGLEEGLAKGKAEGLEEGLAKGIEEGLAKGEKRKACQIAQSLKSLGLPLETIVQTTGLSQEEIDRL